MSKQDEIFQGFTDLFSKLVDAASVNSSNKKNENNEKGEDAQGINGESDEDKNAFKKGLFDFIFNEEVWVKQAQFQAKYSRIYMEELLKEGFSREEAIQIVGLQLKHRLKKPTSFRY